MGKRAPTAAALLSRMPCRLPFLLPQVLVEGVVLEGALTERSPVPLDLQVTLAGTADSPGRLATALERAEGAAAAHLQQAPQATGERLAANFLTILDTG